MINVSSTSRTFLDVAINGVVFKNVASYQQQVTGSAQENTAFSIAYTTPNTGVVEFFHPTLTATVYAASGDVELDSKPTWAY